MLTPKSCDLFNIPFFQFAQLKKYQPESIPQIKADYKENWQIWQQLIQQVAADLGEPFAPPHIECGVFFGIEIIQPAVVFG